MSGRFHGLGMVRLVNGQTDRRTDATKEQIPNCSIMGVFYCSMQSNNETKRPFCFYRRTKVNVKKIKKIALNKKQSFFFPFRSFSPTLRLIHV